MTAQKRSKNASRSRSRSPVKLDAPSSPSKHATFPDEVLTWSAKKSYGSLVQSLLICSFGWAALTFLPWYCLPPCWVLVGTAVTGLHTITKGCSVNKFSRHKWVNNLVGILCSIPIMCPFETLNLQALKNFDVKSSKSLNKILNSPFFWLGNVWTELRASMSWIPGHRRRLVVSLLCLYGFLSIFFPAMLWVVGPWGLFKIWFMPWLIHQFWMSSVFAVECTLPTIPYITENEHQISFVIRFPKWVEYLTHDFNFQLASLSEAAAVPVCNIRTAYNSLQQQYFPTWPQYSILWNFILRQPFEPVDQSKAQKRAPGNLPVGPIDYNMVFFFTVTPIVAIIAAFTVPLHWKTVTLALTLYQLGGLGITAGYHRLFSHRSYDACWPVKFVLMMLGWITLEGSVLKWCSDHRAHHRYTDTPKDPYNIKRGFFYAHMGWLFEKELQKRIGKCDISDLEKSAMLRFQHDHYAAIALLLSWGLPCFIAGHFWGDYLGGFFIAGITRMVFMHHCTFFINSLAHYWGDFTYSDTRTPRDSYVVSLVTFGEGYHNFHHEFPYDYRNGVFKLAYDPGKWLIWSLEHTGLAWNLKRFPENEITKGKLQMQEKRLRRAMQNVHWGPEVSSLPDMTKEHMESLCMDGAQLMLVDGVIHDVSEFVDIHPGGKKLIERYIGKDGSWAFNGGIYKHANAAKNILSSYRLAKLA